VWFHALSVSRGTFGALGFSGGPYVLTAGLELGLGVQEMEMVHDRANEYKSDPDHKLGGISLLRDEHKLSSMAGRLITDIHYGGHVGDPEVSFFLFFSFLLFLLTFFLLLRSSLLMFSLLSSLALSLPPSLPGSDHSWCIVEAGARCWRNSGWCECCHWIQES
jgi:hypothetical protein